MGTSSGSRSKASGELFVCGGEAFVENLIEFPLNFRTTKGVQVFRRE
jgi:hypothetical protein